MTGGGGADISVFASNRDAACVTDFNHGADKLDLTAFGLASASEAKSYAANAGSDVVFTFSPGNELTIEHMSKAHLMGADFIL